MAEATVSLVAYNAPFGLDQTQTRTIVRGTLTFVTGTYATGGLVPEYPFNDVSGQSVLVSSLPANDFTPSSLDPVAPDEMVVYSTTGSGYIYTYVRSTAAIKINEQGTAAGPLPELANTSTLPPAVVSDTVHFIASWIRA